jgi:hypothetical protein
MSELAASGSHDVHTREPAGWGARTTEPGRRTLTSRLPPSPGGGRVAAASTAAAPSSRGSSPAGHDDPFALHQAPAGQHNPGLQRVLHQLEDLVHAAAEAHERAYRQRHGADALVGAVSELSSDAHEMMSSAASAASDEVWGLWDRLRGRPQPASGPAAAPARPAEGLTEMPPLTIWEEPLRDLARARAASARGDGAATQAALEVLRASYTAAHQRFTRYMERVANGAEGASNRLANFQSLCTMALTMAVAPAGLAVSVATGAGLNYIQGRAQQDMEVGLGMRRQVDTLELLRNAGAEAATTIVGAMLGGPITNTLYGRLGARLAPALNAEQRAMFGLIGPEAAEAGRLIARRLLRAGIEALSAIVQAPFTAALRTILASHDRPLTITELIDRILTEVWQGGLTAAIIAMITHQPGARVVAGSGATRVERPAGTRSAIAPPAPVARPANHVMQMPAVPPGVHAGQAQPAGWHAGPVTAARPANHVVAMPAVPADVHPGQAQPAGWHAGPVSEASAPPPAGHAHDVGHEPTLLSPAGPDMPTPRDVGHEPTLTPSPHEHTIHGQAPMAPASPNEHTIHEQAPLRHASPHEHTIHGQAPMAPASPNEHTIHEQAPPSPSSPPVPLPYPSLPGAAPSGMIFAPAPPHTLPAPPALHTDAPLLGIVSGHVVSPERAAIPGVTRQPGNAPAPRDGGPPVAAPAATPTAATSAGHLDGATITTPAGASPGGAIGADHPHPSTPESSAPTSAAASHPGGATSSAPTAGTSGRATPRAPGTTVTTAQLAAIEAEQAALAREPGRYAEASGMVRYCNDAQYYAHEWSQVGSGPLPPHGFVTSDGRTLAWGPRNQSPTDALAAHASTTVAPAAPPAVGAAGPSDRTITPRTPAAPSQPATAASSAPTAGTSGRATPRAPGTTVTTAQLAAIEAEQAALAGEPGRYAEASGMVRYCNDAQYYAHEWSQVGSGPLPPHGFVTSDGRTLAWGPRNQSPTDALAEAQEP